MPRFLSRFYGTGDLHFITCSCYQRRPILAKETRRNLLLEILEQTRLRCRTMIQGYVVTPEHIHLLITEPEIGDPGTFMQILKQRFARAIHRSEPKIGQVWQERFYDFNVWSYRKEVEKLRYVHRNPVERGLVREPEDWAWSSYRWYAYRSAGPVSINVQEWPLQIRRSPVRTFGVR